MLRQPYIRATTIHAASAVLFLGTRYAIEALFLLRTVLFIVGAGMVAFSIVVNRVVGISLAQTLCPDHLLGRMNATTRFLAWAALPLDGVVGGALGTAVGLRTTPASSRWWTRGRWRCPATTATACS